MEQVLINNPSSGDYSLDISGFNVPIGPQEYFVVYEVISDNITVTFPNGEESLVVGEAEVIHWDAINTTEDFVLEYSVDNGTNWINIATVSENTTNYVWNTPASVTGSALVRVSSGSFMDTSDDNFSIAPQVEGFTFSKICPTEVTFDWEAVDGADFYDIYLLGDKFMEVVGSSSTTTITLPIAEVTLWAAIVAKNSIEGWSSLRTIAIRSTGDLIDCPLANDISTLEVTNNPDDFLVLCEAVEGIEISAVISNTGTDPLTDFEVSYQLDNQTATTEMYTGTIMPGEQIAYVFETPLIIPTTGTYMLSITARADGDENPFNDAAILEIFALVDATSLDFEEDFETEGITPSGWSIENNDGGFTWAEATGILGSDGSVTTAAFVDNFAYDAMGAEDFLVTEFFDLTAANAVMSFDLAKAQWNVQLSDRLRVEISTDCGESYRAIYNKTGLDLSTLPNFNATDAWKPQSADDWRTEEIDLSPYVGETAIFRFVNVNGFSNNTFIDNIRINETLVSTKEISLFDIDLFPNPASETMTLILNEQIAKNASVLISNNLGQLVYNEELGGRTTTVFDVSDYMTGLYFMTVTSNGVSETIKLFIE